MTISGDDKEDRADPVLKAPAGQSYRFFRHELLQKIEGTIETARAIGDRTVDTDAQPFAGYDALPGLKRSARVTGTRNAPAHYPITPTRRQETAH